MNEAKRSFFRIHLITAIVMALAAGLFVPEVAAYFKPNPFDVPGRAASISWDLAGTVGNLEESIAANKSGLTVTQLLSQDPFGSTLTVANSVNKEVMRLDLPDHTSTPFLIDHDVMYVAKYEVDNNGCGILAFDLTTRAYRWQTTLMAVGPIDHSKYHNEVCLRLDEDMLVIYGSESSGKYIECVDTKTGNIIGHRAFDLATPRPARSYAELIPPLSKMLGAVLASLVICESLLRRRHRSVAPVA